MTTSIRFCLSYDPLKCDLIAFKMNIISYENKALLTWTLSIKLHVRAKALLHVWSYSFYDETLSTELQQSHMIKSNIYECVNVYKENWLPNTCAEHSIKSSN